MQCDNRLAHATVTKIKISNVMNKEDVIECEGVMMRSTINEYKTHTDTEKVKVVIVYEGNLIKVNVTSNERSNTTHASNMCETYNKFNCYRDSSRNKFDFFYEHFVMVLGNDHVRIALGFSVLKILGSSLERYFHMHRNREFPKNVDAWKKITNETREAVDFRPPESEMNSKISGTPVSARLTYSIENPSRYSDYLTRLKF